MKKKELERELTKRIDELSHTTPWLRARIADLEAKVDGLQLTRDEMVGVVQALSRRLEGAIKDRYDLEKRVDAWLEKTASSLTLLIEKVEAIEMWRPYPPAGEAVELQRKTTRLETDLAHLERWAEETLKHQACRLHAQDELIAAFLNQQAAHNMKPQGGTKSGLDEVGDPDRKRKSVFDSELMAARARERSQILGFGDATTENQ